MIIGKYRIDLVGDLEYKEFVAHIYFEDQILAILTQETGFENLEIEIYPPKYREHWHFRFSEFMEAVEYAKRRLWELRKLPENEQEKQDNESE